VLPEEGAEDEDDMVAITAEEAAAASVAFETALETGEKEEEDDSSLGLELEEVLRVEKIMAEDFSISHEQHKCGIICFVRQTGLREACCGGVIRLLQRVL
jgi:hypothetical protein